MNITVAGVGYVGLAQAGGGPAAPPEPVPIPLSILRLTVWFPNSWRSVPKPARPRISPAPTPFVMPWAQPESPSKTLPRVPPGPSNNPQRS